MLVPRGGCHEAGVYGALHVWLVPHHAERRRLHAQAEAVQRQHPYRVLDLDADVLNAQQLRQEQGQE